MRHSLWPGFCEESIKAAKEWSFHNKIQTNTHAYTHGDQSLPLDRQLLLLQIRTSGGEKRKDKELGPVMVQ